MSEGNTPSPRQTPAAAVIHSPTSSTVPSIQPSQAHTGSASLATLHAVRESKAYQRYASEFDRLLTTLLRTPQADWSAQSAVLTQLLHHLDAARDLVGVAAMPNVLLFDQALARALHVQNPLGVQRKALEVLVRYLTCLAASPWEQQQQQQQVGLAASSSSACNPDIYVSPLHMDYPHVLLAVLELLPESSMQLKGELMTFVDKYVVNVLPPRLLRGCMYGIVSAVLHCLEEAEGSVSYRQAVQVLRNVQQRVAEDTSAPVTSHTGSEQMTSSTPYNVTCTGPEAFYATLWSLVRDCDTLRAPALVYLRLSIGQLHMTHVDKAAVASKDNSFAMQGSNTTPAAVTPITSSSPQAAAVASLAAMPDSAVHPLPPSSPFVSAVSQAPAQHLDEADTTYSGDEHVWLGGVANTQLVLAALLTALQDRREKVQRLVLDLLISYVPLSSPEVQAETVKTPLAAAVDDEKTTALQVVRAPFSFAAQTLLMTAAVHLIGLPCPKATAGVLRRVVTWPCGPSTTSSSTALLSSSSDTDYIAHSSGYVLSQAFYGIVHWWEQTCLPLLVTPCTSDTAAASLVSSSHQAHRASTTSNTTPRELECAATLYTVLQQGAVSALADSKNNNRSFHAVRNNISSSSSGSGVAYGQTSQSQDVPAPLALPYVWLSAIVSLLRYSVTLDEDEAERAGPLASPTMVHEVVNVATPAPTSLSGISDAADGTRVATPLDQQQQQQGVTISSGGEQGYPVLTAALPLLLPTLSHLLVCIHDTPFTTSSSVPARMEALLRRVFDVVPWQMFMQYNAGQVALLRGAVGPLLTQLRADARAIEHAAAEEEEQGNVSPQPVDAEKAEKARVTSLLVPAEQLTQLAHVGSNDDDADHLQNSRHGPWHVLHAQVTQSVRQLRCTAQLLERYVVVQAGEQPGQAIQLYSEVNTLCTQLATVLQMLCEGMTRVATLRATLLSSVILRTFLHGTLELLHDYYLVLRAGLQAQIRLSALPIVNVSPRDDDVALSVLQSMTQASLSLLSLLLHQPHTATLHAAPSDSRDDSERNVNWMVSECGRLQRNIVSAITQATQLARRATDSPSPSPHDDEGEEQRSEIVTLGGLVQSWLKAQLAMFTTENSTTLRCPCLLWPVCEVVLDLADAATPVPREVALLLREHTTTTTTAASTLRPLLYTLWTMLDSDASDTDDCRRYSCERAVDLLLRAHDIAACRPIVDSFTASPTSSTNNGTTSEREVHTTCARIARLFLSVLHRHKTVQLQRSSSSSSKNDVLPRPVVGCMFFTGYCTLLRYMSTSLVLQCNTAVEQLLGELAADSPGQLLQPWLEAFLTASQGITPVTLVSSSSHSHERSTMQVAVFHEESSVATHVEPVYRVVEVQELIAYMHTLLSQMPQVESWLRLCALRDDLPDTLRTQLSKVELPLSTSSVKSTESAETSSKNSHSGSDKQAKKAAVSPAAVQSLRVTTWLAAVVKVLLGIFVQSVLLLTQSPSASSDEAEYVHTALTAMQCINALLQHSLREATLTEATIRIWRYTASQGVTLLHHSVTMRLTSVQAALRTHILLAVQLLAGTRCNAHGVYYSDMHHLPVLSGTHLRLVVDNKQPTAQSMSSETSACVTPSAEEDEGNEANRAGSSAVVAAALRRSAPAVLALPALYQVLHTALAQPGCIVTQWSAFVQQLLPFLFRELQPATGRIYNAFLHLLQHIITTISSSNGGVAARQTTGHVLCTSETACTVQCACYDALTDIIAHLGLLARAHEAERQRLAARKARESTGWLASAFASSNMATQQRAQGTFVCQGLWSTSAVLASTRAVLPRLIRCVLHSLALTASTKHVHKESMAALRVSLGRLLQLLHSLGDGTWYVCYMTQWTNLYAGHIAAALLSTQSARMHDFSPAALASADALVTLSSATWQDVMQALLYLSTGEYTEGVEKECVTSGADAKATSPAMRALLAATHPVRYSSNKAVSHSSLHESEAATKTALSAETRSVIFLDALLQARTQPSHRDTSIEEVTIIITVTLPCKLRRMSRRELDASLALLAELLRQGNTPSAATLTLILHVLCGLRLSQRVQSSNYKSGGTITSSSRSSSTTNVANKAQKVTIGASRTDSDKDSGGDDDLFRNTRYATLLTRVLELLGAAPVHLLNNVEGNNTATMVVTLRVLCKVLPTLLPSATLSAMSSADVNRIATAAVGLITRALLPTLLYGVQSLRASDVLARTPLMITCLHLLRALLATGMSNAENTNSSRAPLPVAATEWPVLRALRNECLNYLVSERFFCYAPEALEAWLQVWRVLGHDKPLRVLLTDKLAGGTSRLSAIITSAESEANQRARQLRCLAFYTLALTAPQANDREYVHFLRDQLSDILVRYSGTLPLPTPEQLGSRAVWLGPMSAVMMLFRVLLLKLYDVTRQSMCALLMPEVMRALMLAASIMKSDTSSSSSALTDGNTTRGKEVMPQAVRAELVDLAMESMKVLDLALVVCPQALSSYRGIFFPSCCCAAHVNSETESLRQFTPLLVPLAQGRSGTPLTQQTHVDDTVQCCDTLSSTHACHTACELRTIQWLPLVCYGDGRHDNNDDTTHKPWCGLPRPVLRLTRVRYELQPDCVVDAARALLRTARLWETNELACSEQRRTTGYDVDYVTELLLADMSLIDTEPFTSETRK